MSYTAMQQLNLIKENKIKLIDKLNELTGVTSSLTWTSTWTEIINYINDLNTLVPGKLTPELFSEIEGLFNVDGYTVGEITVNANSIDSYRFYNCNTLSSINLPDTTKIDPTAFSGCTALASISAPQVTTIGDSAFTNTALPDLSGFDQEKWTTIGSLCFESCALTGSIDLAGNFTVGSYAFKNAKNITSIVIKESMQSELGNAILYAGDYSTKPTDFQFKYFLCEASEQPSTWSSDWNQVQSKYSSGGHYIWPTYWNAKLRDYTFILNNGEEDIIVNKRILENNDLPVISKTGYELDSWYLSSDFDTELSTPYISTDKTTLYARWVRTINLIMIDLDNSYNEVVWGTIKCNNRTDLPNIKNKYYCIGYYSKYDVTTHTFSEQVTSIDTLIGDIPTVYVKCYKQGTVDVKYLYDYTGVVQEVTLFPGEYTFNCWGAQGGYRSTSAYGGLGGYATGSLVIENEVQAYIYVGGAGNTGGISGGFNGGGSRSTYPGGGGASDIRLSADSLYARAIVAGGGGSDGKQTYAGGYGGGLSGGTAASGYGTGGGGASQIAGGSGGSNNSGTFGVGGAGLYRTSGYGGAGGGGWYGGGGTYPDKSADDDKGGGGGSGYVYTADTAQNYPTGCLLTEAYYLTNAETIAGNSAFISPNGSTETGHAGNGYVSIVGKEYGESSISAKKINFVGVLSDGSQIVLNTVEIYHNLYKENLFKQTDTTEYSLVGDYYLDEAFTIKLVTPYEIQFDSVELNLYINIEKITS